MIKDNKEMTIASHEEFELCCNHLAELEAQVAKAQAELAIDLQRVRDEHAESLQPLMDNQSILLEAVESYATLYREELLPKGKKSAETAQARWGWRSNPPSLALQKKVKWELVLNRLRDKGKVEYIKEGKPSPDKDRIKAEFSAAELKEFGLFLKQDEQFYLESKDGKETKQS